MEGFWTRLVLRLWVALVLAFLFMPIVLILVYAFNTSNIQSWPIPGFTLKWFSSTWADPEVRHALVLSLAVALGATALALPGVVAGSIFTFSLTLGDYITPILVGGAGSSLIGTVVYSNVGIANNIPFAAAMAMIPIAIMAVYLLIAQRLGAFEAL